jgi:hypothetical protein
MGHHERHFFPALFRKSRPPMERAGTTTEMNKQSSESWTPCPLSGLAPETWRAECSVFKAGRKKKLENAAGTPNLEHRTI